MQFIGLALGCAMAVTVPAAQKPTIAEALDLYASKHTPADLYVLIGAELDSGSNRLTAEADKWVKAGQPGDRPRRRMIAAAFTLDTLWSTIRWEFLPDPMMKPVGVRVRPDTDAILVVTAWACQMDKGQPSPAERWWYRATVALLQTSNSWVALEGHGYPPSAALELQRSDIVREFAEGHLSHAKARFPDEPRWRLAQVLKVEQQIFSTVRNVQLNLTGEGLTLRTDQLSPDVFKAAARQNQTGLSLDRLELELERTLASLATDPDASLRAEATLRLAYWRLCRGDWQGALDRLGTLSDPSVDSYVRYMAAYFEGWASERLNRRADAIAAYRRAAGIQPNGQSLSVLLAGQLFLNGERTEAHGILDAAFGGAPTLIDPWLLFKLGDLKLVDGAISRMRAALQ